MNKAVTAHWALAATLMVTMMSGADVPRVIDYQAYLSDATGAAIDQPTQMTFSLYRDPTGGAALWTETLTLAVAQGLVSVSLGAGSVALPEDLSDGPLWLGIAVGGDAEMTPRRRIAAGAFALRAQDADALGGASLEDVLTFATQGGIPDGARIPVLDLEAGGISLNPASVAMAVDGRSFAVAYPPLSAPQWAPLAIEYVYPVGSPSPLGVTSGGVLAFTDFDLLLADDQGFGVELRGLNVSVAGVDSRLIDGAGGASMIVERVELQGGFTLQMAAPPWQGPLEVTLSFGGSDVMNVGARGPLVVDVPQSGPGGQPRYLLELDDFGPAEFQLLETSYSVPDQIVIDLKLAGAPVAGGGGCKLLSISGLAPAILDDGGTPVASLRFETARFDCDAAN